MKVHLFKENTNTTSYRYSQAKTISQPRVVDIGQIFFLMFSLYLEKTKL